MYMFLKIICYCLSANLILKRSADGAYKIKLPLAEYADNYRDISYRNNLALSYRIDSRYYGIMIIVSYQNLIICFEYYRIVSNFDNLF